MLMVPTPCQQPALHTRNYYKYKNTTKFKNTKQIHKHKFKFTNTNAQIAAKYTVSTAGPQHSQSAVVSPKIDFPQQQKNETTTSYVVLTNDCMISTSMKTAMVKIAAMALKWKMVM